MPHSEAGHDARVGLVVPPVPTTPAATDPDVRPTRRGVVFAVVSIALFMASVDQTIVATALGSLERDLGGGIEWTSWTITIYSLSQVVVMPLAGKLSDLYGRKRVFLGAVALFTASSLACGLATSVTMLVVLRAVQAVGGGAFMPSATGIVADSFGSSRDRAIGMFTSIFPIGGIVGPIIGGLIVAHASWRLIFFVNVPLGVVLVILGLVVIPASRRRPTQALDIGGVVLLGSTILAAMFAITSLGSGADPVVVTVVVPAVLAVMLAVAFVVRMRTATSPFIPMRFLVGRGFGVMNLINLLWGAAAIGFAVLIPVYAQERFGIDPLRAGTLLTARAVGTICVAGLATFALRRTGYRPPMIAGFVVVAGGLLLMAWVPDQASPYAWMSVAGGITGIGIGLAVPASNNASLQLAPESIAAISGLRGMFRQSGSILAVSVATALAASSSSPGSTLADVFVGFAVVIVCSIPLIFLVPEHRGAW